MGCSWLPTGMKDHRDWKIVKGIGEQIGMPELHQHACRHSRGVELPRRSGENLWAVQEQLRHSDIQTTTVYTRLAQYDLQKVVSTFDTEGDGGRLRVPPPRAPKLWGENNHQVNLVAPTGAARR